MRGVTFFVFKIQVLLVEEPRITNQYEVPFVIVVRVDLVQAPLIVPVPIPYAQPIALVSLARVLATEARVTVPIVKIPLNDNTRDVMALMS